MLRSGRPNASIIAPPSAGPRGAETSSGERRSDPTGGAHVRPGEGQGQVQRGDACAGSVGSSLTLDPTHGPCHPGIRRRRISGTQGCGELRQLWPWIPALRASRSGRDDMEKACIASPTLHPRAEPSTPVLSLPALGLVPRVEARLRYMARTRQAQRDVAYVTGAQAPTARRAFALGVWGRRGERGADADALMLPGRWGSSCAASALHSAIRRFRARRTARLDRP